MTSWNLSIWDDLTLTDSQRKILELKRKGLSDAKVAKELGKAKGTVGNTIKRMRNRAEAAYGTSILEHDINHATGEKRLVWTKNKYPEYERQQIREASIRAFLEDIPKLPKQNYETENYETDIIPWFQIGDAHIGMLAHAREVGHNFDLKIAERELCMAIDRLAERTPACERCVLNDLGDFSHYENMSAKTSKSGHELDFDTRYNKMRETEARILRYMIERLQQKFKYVDVILNQGNHNETNAQDNAIWLRMIYEDNDRVNVLDNSNRFMPYRMGNTLVMTHHSDTCKPAKLADVMATDFKEDHGETLYHYIDIGHIHHGMTKKELGNCIVESWNQMAPSDKYAHDGGWRSRSFLSVVERSKTYGEVGRRTITREELLDCINGLPAGESAKQRRKVYTV